MLFLLACANNPRLVDTLSDSMEVGGVALVDLDTESDGLVVTTAETTTITIEVVLETTRTETTKDELAIDALHLELRDDGEGTARAAVWFDDPIARYGADVTVTLPAALPLIVSDAHGDVDVTGVGGLTLVDQSGDVRIQGVLGPTTIEDGDGEIDVSELAGDLEIDDGAGNIRVRRVEGAVTVRDGSGDIDVEDATEVEIESDGGGEVSVR